MKNDSWVARRTLDPDVRRLFEQERLILSATDRVCQAMDEGVVSRADLARELETSRANISALLNGSRNMTLRTLADLACVLGQRVEITLEPLRYGEFVNAPMRIVRTLRTQVVETNSLPMGEVAADADEMGEELVA
jgi:transcriptional regulator with XRE-family HTH domain